MPRVSPNTVAPVLSVPSPVGLLTDTGRLIGLALVAIAMVGNPNASAQTTCDEESCVYDFSVSQEGYFPDWDVVSTFDVNWLDVRDGVGHLNVLSNGPTFFVDNNAHVIWSTIGKGYPAADATFRFTGDNGRTGWIEKFADGTNGPQYCHPTEHAPRASDEIMVLTLYDDGLSYVGAFIGGDLLPLGEVLPPVDKKGGFAVMGIVQMTQGDSQPRVLDYVQAGPIEMYGANLHLHVSAQEDADGWSVQAEARQEDGVKTYRASARIAPPDVRGSVGLNAITGAKPYCIYGYGGQFNRQFEVSRVSARYEARQSPPNATSRAARKP